MQDTTNILEHEEVRKHLARLRSSHQQMLCAPKPHPSLLLRKMKPARNPVGFAAPVAVEVPPAPPPPPAREFIPVTIPLDPEILAAFKTADWQTRVNSVLLTAVRNGEV